MLQFLYGFTSNLVLLAVSVLVYYVVYLYVLKTWSYFKERGVIFERGLPFLGSFYPTMLGRQSMAYTVEYIYHKYPNDKLIGIYMGGRPSYMIRDTELINAITIKDFDNFQNHSFQINSDLDPLMGRVLFNMHDEKWREMRSILSPMFTGSKMRSILLLINETSDEFVHSIKGELAGISMKSKEYTLMDLYTCATNDLIASCAFGIKINSFKDRNNEFYKTGHSIAYSIQGVKAFIAFCVPHLMKFIKMRIVSENDNTFFRNVILSNVEQREKQNIVRPDMIHLLMQAREGKLFENNDKDIDQDIGFATVKEYIAARITAKLKNWADDDIVAQCLLFFLAGFTAISSTLCFLSHELAVNQDVQDRLYSEVLEAKKSLKDGKLTYEVLQKMSYLDMVVSETLRKYPAAPISERLTSKEYTIENSDGNKIALEPKQTIWIPTYAIHNDPSYWQEPNKFNPERFSNENKGNIQAGTYIPFGIGPRNCIASRFALMSLKAITFNIISELKLLPSSRTQIPLRLKATANSMDAEKGFWIQITQREIGKRSNSS